MHLKHVGEERGQGRASGNRVRGTASARAGLAAHGSGSSRVPAAAADGPALLRGLIGGYLAAELADAWLPEESQRRAEPNEAVPKGAPAVLAR